MFSHEIRHILSMNFILRKDRKSKLGDSPPYEFYWVFVGCYDALWLIKFLKVKVKVKETGCNKTVPPDRQVSSM